MKRVRDPRTRIHGIEEITETASYVSGIGD